MDDTPQTARRDNRPKDFSPRNDIAPRRDVSPRPDIAPRKDLAKGSRPPPTKRPSTSSISILFVMGLVIVGAFVASGNFVPVDPNGPGGPPTLQPYYNPADYPKQEIITPSGAQAAAQRNLQLKTFNVDNCGANSVILFVVDISGSMSHDNKIGNEKSALSYFTNNMGGLSGIGLDSFGKIVQTQVPLSYYKDVKPQMLAAINGLTPGGGTPTRDAMTLAYNQLSQSITNEDYPGYAYNLVLLTDGVPEIFPPRTCYVSTYDSSDAPLPRCFAEQQDPTIPPDITAEIKGLGVSIYSVNIYSPDWPSDAFMFPYLQNLLEKIASPPLSTHYFVSTNATNLSQILKNIQNNICYNDFNGTSSQ